MFTTTDLRIYIKLYINIECIMGNSKHTLNFEEEQVWKLAKNADLKISSDKWSFFLNIFSSYN